MQEEFPTIIIEENHESERNGGLAISPHEKTPLLRQTSSSMIATQLKNSNPPAAAKKSDTSSQEAISPILLKILLEIPKIATPSHPFSFRVFIGIWCASLICLILGGLSLLAAERDNENRLGMIVFTALGFCTQIAALFATSLVQPFEEKENEWLHKNGLWEAPTTMSWGKFIVLALLGGAFAYATVAITEKATPKQLVPFQKFFISTLGTVASQTFALGLEVGFRTPYLQKKISPISSRVREEARQIFGKCRQWVWEKRGNTNVSAVDVTDPAMPKTVVHKK